MTSSRGRTLSGKSGFGDWRKPSADTRGLRVTVWDVSSSGEKISFFCYSGFAPATTSHVASWHLSTCNHICRVSLNHICLRLSTNYSQIKANAACRTPPQREGGKRSLMVVLSGLWCEGLCGLPRWADNFLQKQLNRDLFITSGVGAVQEPPRKHQLGWCTSKRWNICARERFFF